MLGPFAEFERAKIIERTTRGRWHLLERNLPGCQRPQCKQHKNQGAD